MTTSSNANDARYAEEIRRWNENFDRLMREAEEAREEVRRNLAKLEVLEELARR